MKNLGKHLSTVMAPPFSIDYLNQYLERIIENVTAVTTLVPGYCTKMVAAGK